MPETETATSPTRVFGELGALELVVPEEYRTKERVRKYFVDRCHDALCRKGILPQAVRVRDPAVYTPQTIEAIFYNRTQPLPKDTRLLTDLTWGAGLGINEAFPVDPILFRKALDEICAVYPSLKQARDKGIPIPHLRSALCAQLCELIVRD